MNEIRRLALGNVLDAVTHALDVGLDPDGLMQKIIQRGIEVVREKERRGGELSSVGHII